MVQRVFRGNYLLNRLVQRVFQGNVLLDGLVERVFRGNEPRPVFSANGLETVTAPLSRAVDEPLRKYVGLMV